MPFDDDDPVIASYDVYISQPASSTTAAQRPQLYVLQYPSHRPNSKPYSSSRSQKPSSLRLKPNTGIIEVDVPIMTTDNYNRHLGSQFGKAMHESHLAHPTTSHGLSGGFSHNQPSNVTTTSLNLSDVPQHQLDSFSDTALHTQILGGKLSTTTDKDPIYMLATLHSNTREIHLQHLDALVQLRPQLHHIDAADELKKRVESAANRAKIAAASASNTATGPSGASGANPAVPPKLETKAIEMKIKDTTKDDPKDRNLNMNAKLLRDIQNDPWQRYDWVEGAGLEAGLNSSEVEGQQQTARYQLKAALDNDEWLNRMSSPGIELRTRLKGRDRERARRKRQERARASRAEALSGAGTVTGVVTEETGVVTAEEGAMDTVSGSDSSASEDEGMQNSTVIDTIMIDGQQQEQDRNRDGDEDEDGHGTRTTEDSHMQHPQSPVLKHRAPSPEVQIKTEGPSTVDTVVATTAPAPAPATPAIVTPKRRGRPPKNKAA